MKLIIPRAQLTANPEEFLRHAGYGLIFDSVRGVNSFVRRLGSNFYPRLHMYAETQGDNIIFSLHLDQKQASYRGAPMHNAEYEGDIVSAEMTRLKEILNKSLLF
jgi:hypothetical protein